MEVKHGIKRLVLPMDLSFTGALKEIQEQNLYWHRQLVVCQYLTGTPGTQTENPKKTDRITITPVCIVFLSFVIFGKQFQITTERTWSNFSLVNLA